MQLSTNMQIVKNADWDDFFTFIRLIPYAQVPKWEEKLLFDMINERLRPHNLEFYWGCCGTNLVQEIE